MINFEKRYSKKAKNISLKIQNGKVILILPKARFLQSQKNIDKKGEEFLKSKEKWILKHINQKVNPILEIDSFEHYKKHKNQALTLCKYKTEYWAKKMGGLIYNKISVKKLKSKWGSCSSKRNLNFNYKIVFLTEEEQDYLIVHELSHLVHMNHSKEFWDLVCKTLGSEKYRKYKLLSK